METLHPNCRFWTGRTPCGPQRAGKTKKCEKCTLFQPTTDHICIIRGSNLGGALRATGLAAAIKKQDPDCFITWITSKAAHPLIALSPAVDQTLTIESDLDRNIAESLTFWLTINLDPDERYRSLATKLKSTHVEGLIQTELGRLYATRSFLNLIRLRVFPHLNRDTFIDYQSEIANSLSAAINRQLETIPYCINKPEVGAHPRIDKLFSRLANSSKPWRAVVALNVGASARWQTKSWQPQRYHELIYRLREKHPDWFFIVALGPDEAALRGQFIPLSEFGCVQIVPDDLNIEEFATLVARSNCIVTADSLAAHLALAFERPNVILFGATSPSELPPSEISERLTSSNLSCWPCYRKTAQECTAAPKLSCLQEISVDAVASAIERRVAST